MAKIYYIGDWAVQLGPVYAETPFNYAFKGLDLFNYGKWLKEALEATGEHSVQSVSTWDFYKLAPGEWEKILEENDVIIFSDVEAKNFQLAPDFFNRAKFGTKVLTFPDRIRLTIDALTSGKSVLFLGGWLSFNGEMGKGGWGRTRFREVLPVKCLETEDLVESTEGFTAEVTGDGKSVFADIDMSSFPPILGYNRTLPIDEGRVPLNVKETGDPLLAFRQCGKGRVLSFMSDPAPHWGCNFVYWDKYGSFWRRCLELAMQR